MCGVASFLTSVTPQIEHLLFQERVQPAEGFRPIGDPAPHNLRSAGGRERPHTRHSQGKGRFALGDSLHRTTHRENVSLIDLPEKENRDVHTFRGGPLHLGPRLGE